MNQMYLIKLTILPNIGDDKNPDTGGIHWPSNTEKIFSVGAIVYEINGKKQIITSNYSPSLEQEGGAIYKIRTEFASKVYKFGQICYYS